MDDLTGTSGERMRRLAALEADELEAEWLLRQLRLVLAEWEADQKALDIDAEGREDF